MVEDLEKRFAELERKILKEKITRIVIEDVLLFMIGILSLAVSVAYFKVGDINLSKAMAHSAILLFGVVAFSSILDGITAAKKLLAFNWRFEKICIATAIIFIVLTTLYCLFGLDWLAQILTINTYILILLGLDLLIESIIYAKKHKKELPRDKWEW